MPNRPSPPTANSGGMTNAIPAKPSPRNLGLNRTHKSDACGKIPPDGEEGTSKPKETK